RFLDVVAPSVEKLPSGLAGDACIPFFAGGPPHVSGTGSRWRGALGQDQTCQNRSESKSKSRHGPQPNEPSTATASADAFDCGLGASHGKTESERPFDFRWHRRANCRHFPIATRNLAS